MALGSALVDRARLERREVTAPRVEGRTQTTPTTSQWFKARLFLPGSEEGLDAPGSRRRQIKRPTLLVAKKDIDGELVEMKAEMRVEVDSTQLGTATWRIQGDPEPLRKRRLVIGWLATLERLTEPKRDTL